MLTILLRYFCLFARKFQAEIPIKRNFVCSIGLMCEMELLLFYFIITMSLVNFKYLIDLPYFKSTDLIL